MDPRINHVLDVLRDGLLAIVRQTGFTAPQDIDNLLQDMRFIPDPNNPGHIALRLVVEQQAGQVPQVYTWPMDPAPGPQAPGQGQ